MKNKRADGLRGIAAFNVAVAHYVAAFFPMMLHKNYPNFAEHPSPGHLFKILTSPLISIFYNGYFAVLIFFVLSGYVLTLPYFSNVEDSKIILEKRLWGRYLRLSMPIAAAILISYSVYKLGWYTNIQASEIAGSVNYLNNFFPRGITALNAAKEAAFESILFGKATLVPPLWTLKIEFIGSLYILLFYISKPRNAVVVPLLMIFCLIYAIYRQDSIYYFAMFAGSLLNYLKIVYKYKFIFFTLGCYLGGFQFYSDYYDYLPNLNFLGVDIWERKSFYNALGAVLITLSVIQGVGVKVFESRLFQFLGRISFSIYLIHFTVVCSLSSFLYINFPQSKLFWIVNFVLYVVVCFIVSMIFEKVVDRGSISISHKFSSKIFS